MTLNAQERAAVEAAEAWRLADPNDSEMRIRDDARALGTASWSYACGHLSGFRAGVEAALKEAVLADSIEEARYEIRALLAQEDEHGS